jgi:hypothetical protein
LIGWTVVPVCFGPDSSSGLMDARKMRKNDSSDEKDAQKMPRKMRNDGSKKNMGKFVEHTLASYAISDTSGMHAEIGAL